MRKHPTSQRCLTIAACGAVVAVLAFAGQVSARDAMPTGGFAVVDAPGSEDPEVADSATVVREAIEDPQATLYPPLENVARGFGFENVTIDASERPIRVGYENRRFRHSADALGWITRGSRPLIAFERRLGLSAAAIDRVGDGSTSQWRVRFPSDRDFPQPPRGARRDPTSRSVDLTVGPLFAYDLGRITEPVQFQFQTEATLRWNPWPGSRFIGSMVFPMYNDFVLNPLHPDVDNVRPGLVNVQQFAWIPRAGLTSASVGLFADNRYGYSLGIAHPLVQGSVLLDAQTDLTGFVAFNTDGIGYSNLSNWSTFGGVTYRPPILDVSLRARYAQFLYGDHGAELEFKRSLGDLDLAFSLQRSTNLTIEAVRVTFPVPPLTRPTHMLIRTLPVERFPISFRTDATPTGQYVLGTASREEFLNHLSKAALDNNRFRYDRAQGPRPEESGKEPILWAGHSGMTGFIITPWAGVQPDHHIEVGYSNIPRKWAYNPEGIPRGVYHNEIYYASLGLLPRVEVGLRITRTPGFNPFGGIDPESRLSTDTDHMASFRVAIAEPKDRRPGLAFGIEDIQGTRRYHSTYFVSGVPIAIFHVQNRFSLGYASPVFTASRHVLDGVFGAIEVSPWRAVATRIEYDTEKFNVGLGVDLGFGLRIRAAALNMESLSAGVGWHHKL